MPKQSAGLILYRTRTHHPEVFLVHPGGPFWAKKDIAGWSIPKGEAEESEDLLAAAQREFFEETGQKMSGPFVALGQVKLSGGKLIHAWAVEGDCDADAIVSNTFKLEWPPRSGKIATFPEVDRAAWFSLEEAAVKLHKGQVDLLVRLGTLLTAKK